MKSLDDDSLLCVLHLLSGHTLSQLTMVCTTLREFLRRMDSVWGRLVYHPLPEDALRGAPAASLRHGVAPCLGPCLRAYSLAYCTLKFAVRIARIEYTANGMVMKDCVLHLVRTLASFQDDSTLGERQCFAKAWSQTEGVLVRYPVGTYFDAVSAFCDLKPPLSVVLTAMKHVVLNPAFSIPVCQMSLARRGVAVTEKRLAEQVWELKRIARRIAYILKTGAKGLTVVRHP